MKKVIIILALLTACIVAKSADVILGNLATDLTYSEHSAGNMVIRFGGAAEVYEIFIEWLFGFEGATDTSGQSNDGTVIGMTYAEATNGLAAYYDMATATNTITVSTSDSFDSLSFFGNSNGVWRYYEYIGGTQYVNLASESYTTSDWFAVSGSDLTVGGSDNDIAQVRSWNVVTEYADREGTNIAGKAQLGILPQYLADNTNLYDKAVFAWTGNSLYTDGSKEYQSMSSASAPTAGGTVSNGWYNYNGSANYLSFPDADYYAVTNLTVSVWVNPDSTSFDPIRVTVAKSGSSTDRSFAIGMYYTTTRGDVIISSVGGGNNWAEWRGNSGELDLFDTNTWNLMTFVWDGSQAVTNDRVKLYKNTRLITAGITHSAGAFVCPTALYNNDSPVEIGRRRGASTPSGYWDGKLDEVLILSGVSWTPTDITNYYNATTNLFF